MVPNKNHHHLLHSLELSGKGGNIGETREHSNGQFCTLGGERACFYFISVLVSGFCEIRM